MPAIPDKRTAAYEPTGEWLTVYEVAEWLKVSHHHVYKRIAKLPGCKPINVGHSERRPQYRFNRTQLIATLEGKPGWEDEDDFKKLVSPESLTLACLGIARADAQIAPKIGGRLGAAARGRTTKTG